MTSPAGAVAGGGLAARLRSADLEVVGRLADASNAAYRVRAGAGERGVLAIYKPVAGERPLWDFPDGTLAEREYAAWLLSEAGGWGIVPPTVLRDGPAGVGSVQAWVGDPEVPPEYAVDVVAPDRVAPGWLPVMRGEGPEGEPLVVVHEDTPELRAVAVFDAVINNGDRKGSHLVRDGAAIRGFDHGVSLHAEDKLRTVLWGWAGQPLPCEEVDRLTALRSSLASESSALSAALAELLTGSELTALRARVQRLLERAAYPLPGEGWPAIPWPPL